MTEWSASVVNMTVVSLTVIFAIFYMNQFLGLLPYLADGVLRWHPLVSLEDSVRLTRDRNAVAVVAFVAVCTVFSRYDVYDAAFLDGFSPGVRTLLVMATLVGVILLREALVHIAAPRKGNRENYMVAARSLYDFIIIGTVLGCATSGICSIFGAKDLTIRSVLLWESGLVFALFALRRSQILRNSCPELTTFLYLCTLELIPAGLLVASALVF